MNQVIKLLKRARARITPAASWTQEVTARNSNQDQVGTTDPTAVCWCMNGAISLEAQNLPLSIRLKVETLLVSKIPPSIIFQGDYCRISEFNDTHTHQEVLQLFDTILNEHDLP